MPCGGDNDYDEEHYEAEDDDDDYYYILGDSMALEEVCTQIRIIGRVWGVCVGALFV